MARESAGILPYRRTAPAGALEVLIAHPGGPLWATRDAGAWSIVKGEIEAGESPEAAARRELAEELGEAAESLRGASLLALGTIRQRAGKLVHAWAAEGEVDPEALRSATFEMVWPPRSGRMAAFPEIDRVAWVAPGRARELLNPAQAELVDRLLAALAPAAPAA